MFLDRVAQLPVLRRFKRGLGILVREVVTIGL
jgi:hypothetical protein